MRIAIIVIVLASCGCTMKSTPAPGQVVDCVDFRDGDRWTWRSEDLDIRLGIAGADNYVSGPDETGRVHTVNGNPDYIKCVPRKQK